MCARWAKSLNPLWAQPPLRLVYAPVDPDFAYCLNPLWGAATSEARDKMAVFEEVFESQSPVGRSHL